MKYILTQLEEDVLKLYIKAEFDSNLKRLIDTKDPDGKIVYNLIDKGYINGKNRTGMKGDIQSEILYSINGYAISDKTISEFNVTNLPQK